MVSRANISIYALDLIRRILDQRDRARKDAATLAFAYENGRIPPRAVVDRAIKYGKGEKCE